MRIRRRTAVWLCVLFFAGSLGAAGYLLLRPDRLRRVLRDALQATLEEGWEVELDAVDYDLGEGTVRAEGLRILDARRSREVVVSVPRAEASTRLWEFLTSLRITEVSLFGPEVLVERTEDGRLPFLEAIRAGEGPAGGRPRILVQGGLLRLRDPLILAAGEEVRLSIESLDWEEPRHGSASPVRGVLVERGSPVRGGTGALGRVVLRGDLPAGPRGLGLLVERFEWDEFLLERLSPALRERLPLFSMDGTFGGGPDAPGLEVSLSRTPGTAGYRSLVKARPRGVSFLLRDFPVLFTGMEGDATWDDGKLKIDHMELRRDGAKIHLDGSADALAADAAGEIRFWIRDLYLDRGLRNALPPAVRRVWDAYDLSGKVDFTSAPRGTDGSFDCVLRRTVRGGPLQVELVAQVVDGELSYVGYRDGTGVRRGFDYPLTGVTGRVSVKADPAGVTDIVLTDLRGEHGGTVVTGHGAIRESPARRSEVDVTIEARDMALDDDVRRASPAMEERFRAWSPRGVASRVLVRVEQVPDVDRVAHESVTLDLDGRAGVAWKGLPLPLEKVEGTLVSRHDLVDGARVPVVLLQGIRGTTAEGATVSVDGTVEGAGDAALRLSVRAEGLRLDGPLEEAIRAAPMKPAMDVWDRLRPAGPADLRAEIAGTESAVLESLRIELRGVSVQGWGDIRFPVDGLTGVVEESPRAVRLHGLRGTHDGREVRVDGSVLEPGGEASLELDLAVAGAPLDGSLRTVLGPRAGRLDGYFEAVRPADGLRGDATVRLLGPAATVEPSVALEGIRGGAAPLGLRDLVLDGGRAGYAGGIVTLEGLVGSMGDRGFTVDRGRLDVGRGEGSLRVEVRRLRFLRDLAGLVPEETVAAVEEILPDRYFHVQGLDVLLGDRWRRVEFRGTVSLSPRQEGSTGGLGLEGEFDLKGLVLHRGPGEGDPTAVSGTVDIGAGALDPAVRIEDLEGRLELGGSFGPGGEGVTARLLGAKGRVGGRELKDAGGDLSLRDGVFVLQRFRGTLAGGELGASIQAGGGEGGYEGRVTLANAGAARLFTPADPGSELRGKVTAFLEFRSAPGPQKELSGTGSLTLAKGKIFKVPVFDSIYGILGMDAPEFETGKIEFDLKGDRINLKVLDLDSSVLALHKAVGKSHAWLDGRLDVKLLPEFKSLSSGPLSLFTWLPGLVTKPIVERLYTVHVGGTIQRPEVSQQFFSGFLSSKKNERPMFPAPPPAVPVDRLPPRDF